MDEWSQYKYEQARAWLEHVAKLKHAVGASRDMVELFESMLDSAKGLDYTHEHVNGGQYKDRIAEAIIKLDEARLGWAANVAAYADEATDAANRIQRLEDAAEMQALLLHYVDGITWERVCVQMDYSWQRIMEIRKSGVMHMYEHMPTQWRDPMPPAV